MLIMAGEYFTEGFCLNTAFYFVDITNALFNFPQPHEFMYCNHFCNNYVYYDYIYMYVCVYIHSHLESPRVKRYTANGRMIAYCYYHGVCYGFKDGYGLGIVNILADL